MSDPRFVRIEMLPEKAPPVASGGIIGWLRKNLFYSAGSSIATLATVTVLGWMAWSLLIWLANRVIFMDAGQIVEQNEPEEFFNNPQNERTKLFLSQILRH